MKVKNLTAKGQSLEDAISLVGKGEALFLRVNGRTRFVIMRADEGDKEACALRSNSEFMAYLDELAQESLRGPGRPLAEVCKELGIPLRNRPAKRRGRAAS